MAIAHQKQMYVPDRPKIVCKPLSNIRKWVYMYMRNMINMYSANLSKAMLSNNCMNKAKHLGISEIILNNTAE